MTFMKDTPIRSIKTRSWQIAVTAVGLLIAHPGRSALHPPSAAPNLTVPGLINYQGTLQDATGTPPPVGSYTLSFSIYPTAQGGTAIWGPQVFNGQSGPGLGPQVTVSQGRFNVVLGPVDTQNRKLVDVFDVNSRYLEVTVGNSPPIIPRQQLLPTAYAFNAASLDGFTWGDLFTGGKPQLGALAIGQDPSAVVPTDEGILPPLDISGRPRIRQRAGGSNAGLWLRQSVPNSDRAFVGMNGDDAVGLYGAGAGWGLSMDVLNGAVTIPGTLTLATWETSTVLSPSPVRTNQVFTKYVISGPRREGVLHIEAQDHLWLDSPNIESTASSIHFVSDRRLKTKIVPLRDPVNVLSKINGVRYQFEPHGEFARKVGFDLPEGNQVGVLAQDVQVALPEAVACGPNGALSVNYNALTSLLIEAVKQQGRELEELRSELKALREQVRP